MVRGALLCLQIVKLRVTIPSNVAEDVSLNFVGDFVGDLTRISNPLKIVSNCPWEWPEWVKTSKISFSGCWGQVLPI